MNNKPYILLPVTLPVDTDAVLEQLSLLGIETVSAEQAQSLIAQPTGAAPSAALPDVAEKAETVKLDSAGTPWDERIHAGTKSTVTGGTWTRKKKITDELFNQVMAEINPAALESKEKPKATGPAPSAPAPTAPSPPPAAAAKLTPFQRLTHAVGPLLNGGVIQASWLDELAVWQGVASFAELANADEAQVVAIGNHIVSEFPDAKF